MSLQSPDNRDDYLFDLTRWNRAGLSRFNYVDGDAAVWLEELRIAMLGQYLRGVDSIDRSPEKWRDIFMQPPAERQLSFDVNEYENHIVWKKLFSSIPVEVETSGERNERLNDQYNKHTPDYAWETMRAFARAAHIVLGHQDAYANEGYLRTATQWDNLHKLASMVNYQPSPPASATSMVALEVDSDKGSIQIEKGLAMKVAPDEGGAPLIFETLKTITCHPDLNSARTLYWNYNKNKLILTNGWTVSDKTDVATGDLAVITSTLNNKTQALSLANVEKKEENNKTLLSFDTAINKDITNQTGSIQLLTTPENVQHGLQRTIDNRIVIKINGADSYSAGSIVDLSYKDNGNHTIQAVVVEGTKGLLTLDTVPVEGTEINGDVSIEALIPFEAGSNGKLETTLDITKLYYMKKTGLSTYVQSVVADVADIRQHNGSIDIAQEHKKPAGVVGLAYARSYGRTDAGLVISGPPMLNASPDNIVRFEGAPPKSLKQGSKYIARKNGSIVLQALTVLTIRQEADVYYINFEQTPPPDHDKTEFFGPMTQTLRPYEYNKDQGDVVVGGIAKLFDLSNEASDLVKVGKELILIYDKYGERKTAIATILSIIETSDSLDVTLESDSELSGWQAGWTTFYLNSVDISHGESKDPKILGSGDAEKGRQNFQFKIKDISFIPSNIASTGVAPDMDVTVDGIKWEFRDNGDQTAEGQEAWSMVLNEDDTLQIHFRKRLPTGTNNVSILRHRIGVGAKGSNVAGWSINKPMKKNRFVTGIVQPFITAGGASREAVSDIRSNAPSKLASNGRAVALSDFEQLCKRHSSVWQAKAREQIGPGSTNIVDITVISANGGDVSTTLKGDLIDFIKSRALPNTKISISKYDEIEINIHVKIYVDVNRYEKNDVKDNVEITLSEEFSLINRSLGQPTYVAEILATMERVEGVSSGIITNFSLKNDLPKPLQETRKSGTLSAVFPSDKQIIIVKDSSNVTVDVEVQS